MGNAIFKKLNKHIADGKFKSESRKLLNASSDIYWHELSKAKGDRDEVLMSECLLTMKAAAAVLNRGELTEGGRAFFTRGVSVFLKGAVVTCAVVLAFGLSAYIASAAGVDIFELFVSILPGYINIRGLSRTAAHDDHDLFPSGVQTDGFVDFQTVEGAMAALSVTPKIFDLTDTDFVLDNIYGAGGSSCIMLICEYSREEGRDSLIYQVTMYPDNTSFDLLMDTSSDKYEKKLIDGTARHFAYSENELIAVWSEGLYTYQISANMNNSIEFEELLLRLSKL